MWGNNAQLTPYTYTNTFHFTQVFTAKEIHTLVKYVYIATIIRVQKHIKLEAK